MSDLHVNAWFGKEWVENDAKALGVYVALLILRFRVRYSTDIPILCREEHLMESRLKPYLALLLHDEGDELREAVETGKKFLKALAAHTSLTEYEEVLDRIELDFYGIFKEAYLRHVNRGAMAVKIADSDASSFIKRFLSDVASNRFSRGKVTTAGSSILLTPFGDLLDFYGLSEDDVRRFLGLLRESGIMFLDILPAPVLEQDFIESLP
ncbi:MAG: hypothetical protein ACXQTW_05585 [Candidatus Methanospirareceae archaeon]